jgi:hypothetical protein
MDLSPLTPEYSFGGPTTGPLSAPQNAARIESSRNGQTTDARVNGSLEVQDIPASNLPPAALTNPADTGSPLPSAAPVGAAAEGKDDPAQEARKAAGPADPLPKADAAFLTPHSVPAASLENGRTPSAAASPSRSAADAAAPNAPPGYTPAAPRGVTSARLFEQAGNAEMQVKLRSEAWGPIDVRTVVRGSDVGASIRVEGRETQAVLASELPQLEQALSQRSLRVERLDVLQGSLAGGGSNGGGPGHGHSPEPRQDPAGYTAGLAYAPPPEIPAPAAAWGLGAASARLNLRV